MSTVQALRNAAQKFLDGSKGTQPKDVFEAARWEMCGSHLMLMNGLISVYEKATTVPDAKLQDFILYALQFSAAIEHHHAWEENELFPQYSSKFNTDDILKEHEAFHAGSVAMQDYLISCIPAGTTYGYSKVAPPHEQQQFDGAKLQSIIDNFVPPLADHLLKEITYLDPTTVRATGMSDEQMKAISATVESHMKKMPPFTFLVYTIIHVPKECGFPPVPGFVKNVLAPYVFYLPNRKLWQFAPKFDN